MEARGTLAVARLRLGGGLRVGIESHDLANSELP